MHLRSIAQPNSQPWHIKYRHIGTNKALVSLITNPNSNLQVTDKGVYELLEVCLSGYVISTN